MKFFIRIFLSVSLVLPAQYSFADELKSSQCETAINCTVTQGNTTTTTTTPTSTGGGSTLRRNSSGNTVVTTTTNYGSAGAAGTGAYTQAQNAKSKANMTMIAAFAMAALMASQCGPHNKMACVLAGVAAAAGMMAGQKKNQAQQVMNSLGTTGTTDTASTTDTTSLDSSNAEQFGQIKADLAKKGVKLNDDGSTTLSNGSTVAADLNDGSLRAAGFSNAEIGSLRKDLDKMKNDMNKGTGEGGVEYQDVASGSGGYDGGRTAVDSDREIASSGVEADRTEVDKDSASKWNGFFKQYGDSQIGVAQSDIFLMVEKRVDSERKIMGQ